MGKSLIIAEKPSLAKKIIDAIGGMKKEKDYWENNQYIVTSVFGHLLTLYDIEDYTGEEKKSWEIEDLPFFPKEFKYKVKNDSGIKARYELIKKLIARNDVTEIINSGDADREGEVLINIVVYKIFKELKLSKTIKRIWLEDQTENTIRKELKYTRDIKNTENLYNEGLARSYIDWLYGINLTRYVSIKAGTTLNTGRVIIPTVKFIYDRDMAIRNFKPEKYYEIESTIRKNNQDIKLNFKELKFNKEEINKAKDILEKLKYPEIKVEKIEKKEVKKQPKKLFSLATLQNYMSKKYKISLNKTLELVQSLYEKGYLTYPRTNTEYMSEEEIPKVESIIRILNSNGYKDIEIKKSKSIFDSSKVESHSAITITEKLANENSLDENEKKLYSTVKNRFLAVFCNEDCILNTTTITFKILNKDYPYSTSLKGTSIKQEGYLKYENDLSEKAIPNFTEGEIIAGKFELTQKETTPPNKVTEAELNRFFEKPFKNTEIDDEQEDDTEDYKNILKGVEIGTPATRSGTVEKVKKIGYIKPEKNVLSITELGIKFIESLDKLNINLYKEKTVELSQNLKKIYNEEISIDEVLKQEEETIKNIIGQNITIDKISGNSKKETIGICPVCGKEIFENQKAFSCSGYKEGCKFTIWKTMRGKKITKSNAKQLLTKGETTKIDGFKSKTGKDFSAKLVIKDDGTIGFEF